MKQKASLIRIPAAIMASVEEIRVELEAKTPGVQVNTTEAVRYLLLRAIDAEKRRIIHPCAPSPMRDWEDSTVPEVRGLGDESPPGLLER